MNYRHGDLAYLSISGVPFRDFKERNVYYVDKTMLIADILGDHSGNVHIYVRPRRFGKSTNLSMLDAFFNLKYEGNDWFDGLEISKHHEFDGHRNAHPVIRMNLKDILTDTFDNFIEAMTAEIHHAFKAHHELFQTDATTPDEKRLYESLGLNSVPQSLLVNSLKTLSEILYRAYEGRKVVVLIDEYDHPVTEAFDTDSLRPNTQFLGKILSATLKDNDCIELAYITGITRIAKEGMFSGLNSVVVNDVFSERSGERFGFTEREVRDMLAYYGHPEKFDEVREWYDGYRFGDSEVYNMFSVLNYVYHGFEPDGYWAMSGSDEPLIWMMTRLRYRNFPLISGIVRGIPTRSEVIRSMTYDDILEAMGNGEGGTEMLSLMVHSGGTDSRSPVPAWTARDTAVCGVEYSAGLPVSRLSVAYRAPGTPEKYMGTAVPSVMKRFGEEFGHVLCRRLERQFRLDSIPLAGLRYRHDGTFSRKGEESFTVTVLTSGEYVGKAASVTGAVLSSLDGAGASVAEFRDARNVASCAAESRARNMKVSNGYYMEKCISSFLYGAGLASLRDQAAFYKDSFRDSSGCRLFNRFMSELIDSAANLSISCRTGNPDVTGKSLLRSFRQGWSAGGADIIPYPVNYSDSLSLTVPDTRCPVRRTRNTGIDGARMWIFSNGTKVVYRKMPTDGMLYYSFVLRGGYSAMNGMKDGEGAFLSDMLGLCGPQTMAPGNFRPLLAACGISMTPSVSLSNISLSGSLPRERASLLMKSLVSLSSGMTLDKRTVADYLAEERMRLSTVKGEYSGRLFVLDSVICGTDRYSPYKAVSNLHDDLPARALRFFRTEFSQADDGVLIFVGDIPEHEFRKFLQSYMGGFKTVGRRVLKSAVSFHTGSGESTYFVEGSIPGVDVLMSAALPMNPSNFMASRVAVAALEDAMSSCLRDDAVTFSIKNRFAVYPHERLGILVSVRPAQSSSLPYGVEKASPVKLLMDIRSAVSDLAEAPLPEERMAFYRTVVRNRWDSLQTDPEYWIRVMSGRFAGGKNVSSGYVESIQEVTASDVNKVFRLLDEGGSVEYVTKIKGYGVRDDNPDR